MSAVTPVHERGESELAALWDEFKESGDERAREGLILHYAPLSLNSSLGDSDRVCPATWNRRTWCRMGRSG